jgi:UDP-N-acetylmuramoyl-tripeptide--D-alanyl-D-alanine ligase
VLDLDTAAREIGAGRRGPNLSFDGVTTDSRQVARGDLFVALRGGRFDGHAFADQALAAGAVAAMVEDPDRVATRGASLILVDDTLQGLGRLAGAWRARFAPALAGVTGSNGKTTVKEMIAGILRAQAGDEAVLATSGNLNNAIGVPLMLLRLRSHHRYAVIEMGMNHLGEIRYLTKLAAPTVAVVTNAGTAHIGEVGSREAIAQAKGEIYEGLREGTAVINADDRFAGYWHGLNAGRRIVDFGFEQPAAVRGSSSGPVLSVRTPDAAYELRLRVPGAHNAHNALAACAVACALAMPPAAVVHGLQEYEGSRARLQRRAGTGGSLVIDDTYNANPDSTRAAIAVLAAQPGTRILVLGDMGELGPEGPALHAEVGAEARRAGIDRLFALGPLSAETARAFGAAAHHFTEVDALVSELSPLLRAGVTVLVKGSRFMRMERVVSRLADGEPVAAGDH